MNATNYQKVRLWSGIFSIGTNLGLICAFALFFWSADAAILAKFSPQIWLVLPVLAFLALGFFFDVLSGHAAETALGRTKQGFGAWLRDWISVSIRGATALYVALLFLGFARFWSDETKAILLVFAAIFALVLTNALPLYLPRSWRANSEKLREYEFKVREELRDLQIPTRASVVWIAAEDETSVNGALAPLGRAQIWLSTNVARHLEPRQTALLVARDFYFRRTKKQILNAAICVLWLLFGLGVSLFLLPAKSVESAATTGAAWMSFWCFAALFVWPHLNRAQMAGADRFLLSHASPEEIAALLRRVQELNGTDTQLSRAKSAVFHPIPSLESRLSRLEKTP